MPTPPPKYDDPLPPGIPRRSLPKGFSPGMWRARREWLRTDAAFPAPPFKEGEAVGEAVGRVVEALGVPAAAPALLRLSRDWKEIVGADYAQHATPGALENGVLTIFVHGGATRFATLKRTAARDLVPRLNAALSPPPAPPLVRSVRVMRAT